MNLNNGYVYLNENCDARDGRKWTAPGQTAPQRSSGLVQVTRDKVSRSNGFWPASSANRIDKA